MTPLQQLIIERIQREGPITFAEYMRMALYEPGYGYYVTGPARMGWEGDYFTSTDVSNFFAHCMGSQLQQLWEKLRCPKPFVVLEQGAGRGDLTRGVQEWADEKSPDFGQALSAMTEDMRTGQDVRLQAQESATPTRPHVIISNELVDAFPVHVVEKRDNQLYEVYVDALSGRLREILDTPNSPQVAEYLDTHAIPWQGYQDGWRAEINLDAEIWMQQAAQRLQAGYLLTIDYGEKAKALYTPHRYRGTLTSYYQHQLTERPLTRPGEQDLTAHVNFSGLIAEGRRQGLKLVKYTTQKDWLESLGIQEELNELRTSQYAVADTARASDEGQVALFRWYNLRQRVATLTDPAGMGNFKVLLMRKPA